MSERSGGCLCGAVRYRIAGEPVAARLCWCRECQRIAANGTANAMFPSKAIAVEGAPASFSRQADSGATVTLRFCGQCGTQLFSDSSGRPGLTVVRAGTLDDPSSVRMSANIWAASAPAWACLDSALPRIERAPPPVVPR